MFKRLYQYFTIAFRFTNISLSPSGLPIFHYRLQVYQYFTIAFRFTNISLQYMCTLSADIKFICKSFINRKKREPLISFSGLFHNENIYILHLFSIVSSLMSVLILLLCPFLLITNHLYFVFCLCSWQKNVSIPVSWMISNYIYFSVVA
jgi:hypothetical protein